MISLCQRHDFIIRKAWMLSRLALLNRASLIHRYGKVSFATIVATSFMRSITSFAVRQHRFPTANENDICAFGAKWCSSLRSEIRPYGSWSPFPAREGSRSPSNFTKIKMICIDPNTYHLILSLIGARPRRGFVCLQKKIFIFREEG